MHNSRAAFAPASSCDSQRYQKQSEEEYGWRQEKDQNSNVGMRYLASQRDRQQKAKTP